MPESHQVGSSNGVVVFQSLVVVATVPSSERCTLQSLPGKTFTSDFALGTLVQHPRGGPELKLRQCLPNMVVFQSLVHDRVTPGR